MCGQRIFAAVCLFLCLFVSVAFADKPAVVDLGPLRLHICSERVIRVVYDAPLATVPVDSIPSRVVKADWPAVAYTTQRDTSSVTVRTAAVTAMVQLASLQVAFYDSVSGAPVLQESGRVFNATTEMGQTAYKVQQNWKTPAEEALYGGGEYQSKFLQYSGAPIQMSQCNTEAVIPFFVSSGGFGVLWDNYGISTLNPADAEVELDSSLAGVFTSTAAGRYYFTVQIGDLYAGSIWSDAVQLTLTAGATTLSVVRFPAGNNVPLFNPGRVTLAANTRYTVQVTRRGSRPQTPTHVFVRSADSDPTTVVLRSELGYGIDYYFMLGAGKSSSSSSSSHAPRMRHHHSRPRRAAPAAPAPAAAPAAARLVSRPHSTAPTPTLFDSLIALYRDASGAAPMYPRWAYGFWQCRERYNTQDELLTAAAEYRKRQLPVDNIVQDWHYWGNLGWGPQWDPAFYPDPASMVATVHNQHIQLMVSVWSRFDTNTKFYKEMNAAGELIPGTVWFDAFAAPAREQFFSYINDAILSIGTDALWLDATEPEGSILHNVALPSQNTTGNRLFNPYSMYVTGSFFDGMASIRPDARVFSLTRSSFAGQQRTGGALWSGDTDATWDQFERQISAGLGFQLSGMPYWTQDIGGFFRPANQYKSADYIALYTRWLQCGVFTPLFRIHGSNTTTEPWNFGTTFTENFLLMDNLRYRLLPYIYSLASYVTRDGYTMQRAMAFDFLDDPAARELNLQYMFGPAFLVAPVTVVNQTTQQLYLPAGSGDWVDFWTGEVYSASVATGVWATVPAPLEHVPLLVRAGAVVPLGPLLQYWNEAPTDPIELRIYGSGSGSRVGGVFSLYEDDGLTLQYSHDQAFAEIPLSWDGAARVLHIGARQGRYSGMLETRTFHVVLVAPEHGTGVDVVAADQVDAVVEYSGDAVDVPLPLH